MTTEKLENQNKSYDQLCEESHFDDYIIDQFLEKSGITQFINILNKKQKTKLFYLLKRRDTLNSIKKEFDILKDFEIQPHRNIIKTHFAGISAHKLRKGDEVLKVYYLMENCEGGSLGDMKDLTLNQIKKIMHEFASAFDYLERLGIAHMDLKPDNILFDREGHVKIIDFGCARISK